MKNSKSASKKSAQPKSRTITYEEHQQWHIKHHESLIELGRDYKVVTGKDPSDVMDLYRWSLGQCQFPENPAYLRQAAEAAAKSPARQQQSPTQ